MSEAPEEYPWVFVGINLSDGDEIIGMQLCYQGDYLLIVSEKGMGKRTSMSEFYRTEPWRKRCEML